MIINKQVLEESIEDSEKRIASLKAFETLTTSANIPDELKAKFKHSINQEVDFLAGILDDDLSALEMARELKQE